MTRLPRIKRRHAASSAILGLAALALLVGLIVVATNASPVSAQQLRGHWNKLGQAHKEIYHGFGAVHPDGGLGYLVGGVEAEGGLNREILVINLITGVVERLQINGLMLPRAAPAGAVRFTSESKAIYAIGGGETAEGGFLFTGTTTVQELDLTTGEISQIRPSGTFRNRLLHAAAYDPLGDRIVVYGGTRDCTLRGVGGPVQQLDCRADYDDVLFLQFDDAGGPPRWEKGPTANGPGRSIGTSMVYDPTHQRMLMMGGSLDGDRGLRDVYALNLKPGEDPTWEKMSPTATGAGPAGLFIHAAAMDYAHDRMVVYGGVSSRAFAPGENINDATWLLEIDPTDAAALNWRQCFGAQTPEQVAAAMVPDIENETVVLMGGRQQSSGGPTRATSSMYRLVCEADVPEDTPTATEPATAEATSTSTPTLVPPTSTSTATPTAVPTDTPTATATATAVPLPIYMPVALRNPCMPSSYHSDVALVLDLSTSMNDMTSHGITKLEGSMLEAKHFATLMRFEPDKHGLHDQLAIVGFNKRAWIEQGLTNDLQAINGAIDRLPDGVAQYTRLDLGLEYGAKALRPPQHREENTKVLILLTDGLPDQVPYDPDDGTVETTVLKAADAAKQEGALIYTIAIGEPEDTNTDLLKAVASSPSMYYYEADAADLSEVYSQIVGTLTCPRGTAWPPVPEMKPVAAPGALSQ